MRWITEAEFEVLAVADPDAEAMIRAKWRAARRVPHVRTLRRELDLMRQEIHGGITGFPSPGTLRDWKQGRPEVGQPARACLKLIAHDAAISSRLKYSISLSAQLISRLRLAEVHGDLFQCIADFLSRQTQFVVFLKIHPDIRSRAEPLAEA